MCWAVNSSVSAGARTADVVEPMHDMSSFDGGTSNSSWIQCILIDKQVVNCVRCCKTLLMSSSRVRAVIFWNKNKTTLRIDDFKTTKWRYVMVSRMPDWVRHQITSELRHGWKVNDSRQGWAVSSSQGLVAIRGLGWSRGEAMATPKSTPSHQQIASIMSRALPPAGARQSASLIHEKCRSYQSPSSITSEPIAGPTSTWQNLVDRPGFSYTLQCFVMWIAKWKSGKLGSSLRERSLVNARLWCVKCRLILTSNRSHSRHYRASPMHHKKQ